VVLVEHVIEQDLEAVGRTGARRGESGNGRIARFSNLTDCSRCVVGWNRIDAQIEQHVLGLSKRLRVGTDFANALDRGAGHTVERVAYFNEVLGEDGEPHVARIAWKPIEHWKYRPGCRVLHRDHETVDFARLKRIESCGKTTVANELAFGKELCCSAVAIAVRLSLIPDLHETRP
jgi:hypothetical protein